MTETDLPLRYKAWIARTQDLYSGLKKLSDSYPESINWTPPIFDTLSYIMFGERPSENDWIEMILTASEERKHTNPRDKP